MKLFKQSFLSFFIIVSLIIGCAFPICATNYTTNLNIDIEELIAQQSPGEIAFANLNQILIQDAQIDKPQYSNILSNYGGSSIDKNGNLIVYLSDTNVSTSKITAELNAAKTPVNSIQFVYVEYSYEELKAYQNVMWSIRNQAIKDTDNTELNEWANKIKSVAINPINNNVTILAYNFTILDYAYCDMLFSGYPYEVTAITSDYQCIEETTSLRPGQLISTGGSIGYRCRLNGVWGFVTSIHTANFTEAQAVTVNDDKIGEIVESIYDGSADFAFVKATNADYEVTFETNTTPSYHLTPMTYIISLPVGKTVYLAGATSNTVRTGQIIYFDFALGNGTSWMRADYDSASGDSGGCVFTLLNDDFVIIGVHNGRVGSSTNNHAYVTKHSTMEEYFNLVIQ